MREILLSIALSGHTGLNQGTNSLKVVLYHQLRGLLATKNSTCTTTRWPHSITMARMETRLVNITITSNSWRNHRHQSQQSPSKLAICPQVSASPTIRTTSLAFNLLPSSNLSVRQWIALASWTRVTPQPSHWTCKPSKERWTTLSCIPSWERRQWQAMDLAWTPTSSNKIRLTNTL